MRGNDDESGVFVNLIFSGADSNSSRPLTSPLPVTEARNNRDLEMDRTPPTDGPLNLRLQSVE
jgi:hypothetical protein